MSIDYRRDRTPRTHGPYFGAGHAAVLAIVLWVVLTAGILWRLAH